MNSRIFIVMSVLFLAMSCGDDGGEQGGAVNIRWADSVIAYSTQYDTVEWSAHQALGTPDTYPEYGDIETAWTSELQNGQREYLELGFNMNPQPIRSIAIFETYNPGFVDTVYIMNSTTNLWEIVYQDSARPAGDSSRINIINFPETAFNVSAVRIAMDMTAVPGWNEIDAVGLSSETIPPYSDSTFWAPIFPSPESVTTKGLKFRMKR